MHCSGVRKADINCDQQTNLRFFSPPASSFYPGYDGRTSIFDPEPGHLTPRDNDAETEEWTDEEDMTDLTQRQPGKFDEAIANEVRF